MTGKMRRSKALLQVQRERRDLCLYTLPLTPTGAQKRRRLNSSPSSMSPDTDMHTAAADATLTVATATATTTRNMHAIIARLTHEVHRLSGGMAKLQRQQVKLMAISDQITKNMKCTVDHLGSVNAKVELLWSAVIGKAHAVIVSAGERYIPGGDTRHLGKYRGKCGAQPPTTLGGMHQISRLPSSLPKLNQNHSLASGETNSCASRSRPRWHSMYSTYNRRPLSERYAQRGGTERFLDDNSADIVSRSLFTFAEEGLLSVGPSHAADLAASNTSMVP